MTKNVQQIGVAGAELAEFIGLDRQMIINTDDYSLTIHDGETPGGHATLTKETADATYLGINFDQVGAPGPTARGIPFRQATGSYVLRSITVSSSLTITNADGFAAAPEIDLATNIAGDHEFAGDIIIDGVLQVNGGINGNTSGTHDGPVNGNVTGNVTGAVTGDVTGDLTGNQSGGSVHASDVTVAGATVLNGAVALNAELDGPNGVTIDLAGRITTDLMQTISPTLLVPTAAKWTAENAFGTALQVSYSGASATLAAMTVRLTSTGARATTYFQSGASVGNVTLTSSATQYNTSSDETLKVFGDEHPYDVAMGVVESDPVRHFNWIPELGGHSELGWSAQHSHSKHPSLATPGGWFIPATHSAPVDATYGVDADGKVIQLTARVEQVELTPEEPCEPNAPGGVYVPWSIEYGKRVPYLWTIAIGHKKMIAAQQSQIDDLTRRLILLESKVA